MSHVVQGEDSSPCVGTDSMIDLKLKALHLVLSFQVPCSLIMEYLLSDCIYKAFSNRNNMGSGIDYFSLHKMGEIA